MIKYTQAVNFIPRLEQVTLWKLLNEKYKLPKEITNLKIEAMSINDVVTMTYTTYLRAKE